MTSAKADQPDQKEGACADADKKIQITGDREAHFFKGHRPIKKGHP